MDSLPIQAQELLCRLRPLKQMFVRAPHLDNLLEGTFKVHEHSRAPKLLSLIRPRSGLLPCVPDAR